MSTAAINNRLNDFVPANQRVSTVDSANTVNPWILHPLLDLLFCCGGLVWVFFIVHFFGFGPENLSKQVQIMLSLAALGAIGLSETHIIATFGRVYKSKSGEKFCARSNIIAIACLLLTSAGTVFPSLTPILLKVYLLFVAQHFTAQTFGLSMLYCAKRNYFMGNIQRKLLGIVLQSTMWVAVLRQFTWKEWSGDEMLGVKLPFWGGLPEWVCQGAELAVAISGVAFLITVTYRWLNEGKIFPLPAALMSLTGIFVFLAGKEVSQTLWIYVPAFYHGSQYLVVSLAMHIKEKGMPEGMSADQIGQLATEPIAMRYLGGLLLSALAVFQVIPFIVGLLGVNSIAFAASGFAAIHFHHFITDRAIWKLQDPELRKLML